MSEQNYYSSFSLEELRNLPTSFQEGLFREKVVLVSGGGGGIGMALCSLFARLGASIVACGRDQNKLDVLAEQMEQLKTPYLTHSMTIRDPEQVVELMDAAWERFGKLDVLINNAGGQFAAHSLDITPKGWNAVIDTNLNGTWYMMTEAARRWRDHEQSGSIINIVAILERTSVGIPHTTAARAGQIYLSRTLALEWAPLKIRINCVAPGVIASPGLNNYPPSARASFDHNLMRSLGDVHDIAETCAFLASPSAKFINGELIMVDGGEHVWGEYWPLGKPDYFTEEKE